MLNTNILDNYFSLKRGTKMGNLGGGGGVFLINKVATLPQEIKPQIEKNDDSAYAN